MNIKILDQKINIEEVKKLADSWYGTMIKGTVDVELRRVALGGDYHIESSEILTSSGSKFEDVWGFNIRFEENKDGVLEFDSMVNINPFFIVSSLLILRERLPKLGFILTIESNSKTPSLFSSKRILNPHT